ncbi:hypothetical protein JN27_22520 [Massilia sp. BSC265]|nr:hypothetical protein JN27_22520 [Massilia sp. BSC265]
MHAEVLSSDVSRRVKSGAWCVQLRYQYVIDNKAFASSRLSLENRVACYRDKQLAHALLGRFQPGAKVAIRYDPSDPEKSIIDVDGVDCSDLVFLASAIVLLAAGILLLKRGATGSRRQG